MKYLIELEKLLISSSVWRLEQLIFGLVILLLRWLGICPRLSP
jgi:hypothetical protein